MSQDFTKVINFVSDYGIEGVEIRSCWNKLPHEFNVYERREIRDRATDAGVTVCGVDSPVLKCDLSSRSELREHEEILRRSVDCAEEWGSGLVRTFTGWRAESPLGELNRIADIYGASLGPIVHGRPVRLGIENEFSTNIATGAEARALFDKIENDMFTLVWDPCNILYLTEGHDPHAAHYSNVQSIIGHVHIKDARKETAADPVAVRLGDGDAQIHDLLVDLRSVAYAGWVVLETHWRVTHDLGEAITRVPRGEQFSDGGEEASRQCVAQWLEWDV